MASREELIALLSSYLTGQATNPSWYYTASPAELETLYKDYIKSQYLPDVTQRYRAMGDTPEARQMFNLFQLIDSGQRNADSIIAEYADSVPPMSEEQKADLKAFESQREALDKAELERYANAEIYGLPSPDPAGWAPPMEMLKGLEPVQKGGMTELATNQRWLRDAQKKLLAAQEETRNLEQGPMIGEGARKDPGYRKNFTSALWNDTLGNIFGEVDRDPKPQPKRQPTREATQARNTAYVTKRAAEMRVQQDSTFTERLANEIARQMVEKYGTPYDAAITTARRLAEEEAAKKYGPKSSGSSGLSEWDKEQNRKRELIEGRGI